MGRNGLRQMNYRFIQIAGNMWNGRHRKEVESEPFIELMRKERDNNEIILRRLKEIVDNETVPAVRRLQQSTIVINTSVTNKSILTNVGPSTASSSRQNILAQTATGSRGIRAGVLQYY